MRILKKSLFCSVLGIVLYGSLMNTLFANVGGAPAYQTGAPNDLGTCGTDVCHNTYGLNSGGATLSITAPAVYTPGKSVKIKVSFSNFSGKLRGFEMTAIDANGNRVGTFKKKGTTTQVIPPNDYRGLESADEKKYIESTFKGAKKKSWKFKWKAPSDATDPITFYATGCDSDGDGTLSNDYIYATTAEISAAP